MRILSITAGAAGMYCGSCLRDNALATELIARGNDVSLVPLYTPTRVDEPNVSRKRVLFGGISVFLQQHSAVFRKTPRLLDRLWTHATQPALCWTQVWRAGDMVIWDNRCVLHRRDDFNDSYRRVMHRTKICGERPV